MGRTIVRFEGRPVAGGGSVGAGGPPEQTGARSGSPWREHAGERGWGRVARPHRRCGMTPLGWPFRQRGPTPIQVRWKDGEPIEFERSARRGPRFLVTGIRDRWIEESPWPFPSPMPIGGDRLRCWRVEARSAGEPDGPPREFVLRMRAGPGVWDLVRPAG